MLGLGLMPLSRHIYFWGEGVVGFMPLFRCIYFLERGWALCLFFRCIYLFFYIFLSIFLLFWGGLGVGLNASF